MILGKYQELFLYFSGFVFLTSLILYVFFIIIRFKSIISAFKKIPIWFVFVNLALLVYKLFVIPPIIFRQNFGVWILSMAKSETIWTALFNQRAPVFFFIINLFSLILDGVGFIFVSNFNIILSFLTVFFIYYIVFVLFKNKLAACSAALFYALVCPIFIYSMTECYTTPALFFATQALFFIVLYISKRDYAFLLLGAASSYLAVGSRPEYIIFDLIFLVFIYLFVKGVKLKHYLIYFILFLPKFFIALNMYLSNIVNDEFLIGRTFVFHNLWDFIHKVFVYRLYDFIADFKTNLLAIANPFSLVGVLLFFSFLFIINWKKAKSIDKKTYLFFLFYFLVFFFYYSFLHRDGVSGSYKYISSMMLPLSILAAMGLSVLFKSKYKIGFFLVLSFFFVYALWIGSPITYGMYPGIDPRTSNNKIFTFFDRSINDYLRPNQMLVREWERYNSLKIQDRYNLLTNSASVAGVTFSGKIDSEINLGENNLFISNGARSFLYSIPAKGEIHQAHSLQGLKRLLKTAKENQNIYISQGILGFEKKDNISYFRAIDPIEFENFIKEELVLKEELISYYDNGHHVFLYKMILKNEE